MVKESASPGKAATDAREKRHLIGTIFAVSCAVVLAALVGATIYLQGIKRDHVKEAEGVKKEYLALAGNAARIKSAKMERLDFFKKRFFLDHAPKVSFAAADFLRRLSLANPGDVRLTGVTLKPLAQKMAFVLKGRVPTGEFTGQQMPASLRKFCRKMARFPHLARLSPPRLGKGRNRGTFTLRGEIEIE